MRRASRLPAVIEGERLRLVLVVNEARRTGAPLSVLELIGTIDRTRIQLVVVALRAGVLISEFERASDETLIEPGGLWGRLCQRLQWRRKWVVGARLIEMALARAVIRRTRPDVVYADTVASIEYALAARRAGLPAILHCREVEPTISWFVHGHRAAAAAGLQLFANSRAAAADIAHALSVQLDEVSVVYSPVDTGHVRRRSSEPLPPSARRLGRPLIVGCGVVSERKGVDLWLSVAERMLADPSASDAQFVWVGGGQALPGFRREATARGLGDRVMFTGELANPYPLLAAADVCLVTSRSEPLSKVAIEALALETPVVAFNTGGVSEVLAGCGVLIDEERPDLMAAEVVSLLADSERRSELIAAGRARAVAEFDLSVFRPRISELIAPALTEALTLRTGRTGAP